MSLHKSFCICEWCDVPPTWAGKEKSFSSNFRKSWIAERVVTVTIIANIVLLDISPVRIHARTSIGAGRRQENVFFVRKFHSSPFFNNEEHKFNIHSHHTTTPPPQHPRESFKCDVIQRNKIAKFESFFFLFLISQLLPVGGCRHDERITFSC